VISYGRKSCIARVAIGGRRDDDDDDDDDDENRENENRDSDGGGMTFPHRDYQRGDGGLIMTSGWDVDVSGVDPCVYPWWGGKYGAAEAEEEEEEGGGVVRDTNEKHDDDNDGGCAIEFEFRCTDGGGGGGRDELGLDAGDIAHYYEVGFDYYVGGDTARPWGIPPEDGIGDVEFLLNGGAMSTHGGEDIVGERNTAVGGIRGSRRRAWGAVDAVPATMMGDDEGDGIGGGSGNGSGGGWNTMRLAVGGRTRGTKSMDGDWIMIGEGSLVCNRRSRGGSQNMADANVDRRREEEEEEEEALATGYSEDAALDSDDVPVIKLPSTFLPETDDSTPYVILDTQTQMVIQTPYKEGDGGGEVSRMIL
jgi:hypothetical protein